MMMISLNLQLSRLKEQNRKCICCLADWFSVRIRTGNTEMRNQGNGYESQGSSGVVWVHTLEFLW